MSDNAGANGATGTDAVKAGLARMLKGGVIMDVVDAEQAKIAEDAGAVADIEFVVDEAGELGGEAALVPAGVTGRAEEDGALVVVDAVHGVAELAGEIDADFGADEAG